MKHRKDKVLAVDDEPAFCRAVKMTLAEAGVECLTAPDAETGLATLDDSFTGVLMDLSLPGMDGIACIKEIRRRYPALPCVVLSGAGDIKDAVDAMKAGAFDYLRKPFDSEELLMILRQAMRSAQLDSENRYLRSALGTTDFPKRWIGVSKQSDDLLARMTRIAASDATVLITGETGTGKSLLARLIHNRGRRASLPFVTVSCGTLPRDLIEAELFGHEKGAFTGATQERPGRVEIAGKGTLYLDEIGDLPLSLQPKVLRMLQEREFERVGGNDTRRMEARVIASTNRNLLEMRDAREFREDLFFRLSVLPVDIPPLRQRKDDIDPIARTFLSHLTEKEGRAAKLAPEALQAMIAYDWPGNVRELQNVLERAFTFANSDLLAKADLTFLRSGEPAAAAESHVMTLAGRSMAEIEKIAIEQTLAACHGNKAKAARMLGISEKTIYNKMARLDIRAS